MYTGETLQVLQEQSSVMAIAGSAMSFHCTIDARFRMSTYTMQWYRQAYYGAPVQFLMMEYEQATKKMNVAMLQAENKFSLHISDLTLQDNGIYYCAAWHSKAKVGLSLTKSLWFSLYNMAKCTGSIYRFFLNHFWICKDIFIENSMSHLNVMPLTTPVSTSESQNCQIICFVFFTNCTVCSYYGAPKRHGVRLSFIEIHFCHPYSLFCNLSICKSIFVV